MDRTWAVLRNTLTQRPLLLLPVLAPVLLSVVVGLVAPAVPTIAAAPIAIILAFPGAILAWSFALQAGDATAREATLLTDHAQAQIEDRRRMSLLDNQSLFSSRWYFDLRLSEEVERAKRYGLALSLLLIAPSGLSQGTGPTDWLGLSQELRRRLRASDLPALLSDNLVAVIMPNLDARAARQAARRLRSVVASLGYVAASSTLAGRNTDGETLVKAALGGAERQQKRKKAA